METTVSMTPAQRKAATYADRLRAAADLIDTNPKAAESTVSVPHYDTHITLYVFDQPTVFTQLAHDLGATRIKTSRHLDPNRRNGSVHLTAMGGHNGVPVELRTVVDRVPGMVIPASRWEFPTAWLDGRFAEQAEVSS